MSDGGPVARTAGFGWLTQVPIEITVELGRAESTIADVLALRPGSMVPLDRPEGDRLRVFAMGRLLAFGEAVAIDDQWGVRITGVP